jgi:hypothetical protein
MHDTVSLESPTPHRPAPQPPSPSKAALRYLAESGAAPISIVEVDGACVIRGKSRKPNPDAAAVFWIKAEHAKGAKGNGSCAAPGA